MWCGETAWRPYGPRHTLEAETDSTRIGLLNSAQGATMAANSCASVVGPGGTAGHITRVGRRRRHAVASIDALAEERLPGPRHRPSEWT